MRATAPPSRHVLVDLDCGGGSGPPLPLNLNPSRLEKMMDLDSYMWLLPPSKISMSGESLSLVDYNQKSALSFPKASREVLQILELLDGERTESALLQLPIAAELLPVLDREQLLVRLQRPLSKTLQGRSWASRQLAYYAQLTRQHPDRTLDLLAGTTVAIIGMGGIGSQAAQALAGAGVGRFILSDFDEIDASNLNRQFMYTTRDVGRSKVDVARDFLLARHPHLQVETAPLNPFYEQVNPFESADLLFFCGESHLTGPGRGLDTTKPIIRSGYVGPVGLIGPVRWPERGTACTLCTLNALGKDDWDEFYKQEVKLPTSWNCSGSTINGLMGNLITEFGLRIIAPWLGPGLGDDEVLYMDMRTLEMTREAVPWVECPHRRLQ